MVLLAVALLPVGGPAQTEQKKIPAVLQQVHQSGRIRVFYHTEGQHAVDMFASTISTPIDLANSPVGVKPCVKM